MNVYEHRRERGDKHTFTNLIHICIYIVRISMSSYNAYVDVIIRQYRDIVSLYHNVVLTSRHCDAG